MYAAGLILYELCHKMRTVMQKINVFKDLKVMRQLKSQCPLRQGLHVEHDIIMMMTEEDPAKRPTSAEIKKKWLPIWAD